MNQDQLEKLPLEELRDLAMKEGIARIRNMDRNLLIEQLLELYSDDDGDSENNPTMVIKERKYDLAKSDSARIEGEMPAWELPERYNETKIVLLLRDPNWAFAYWDIREADIELYRNNPYFRGLFIRVYRTADISGAKDKWEYFDIPVKLGDLSWYINLPELGISYMAELRVKIQGEEKVLCSSNYIFSPASHMQIHLDQDSFRDSGNDFLILSQLYGFGDSSDSFQRSKKIISLMDSQYPDAGN